ncbi:MAG: D-tyrosyl-tRNA(Tyr) deacylase [Elusimicrobia bacterium]|nr:D-tyrosyl-tRNA(Tyr) deacylase [Elusimicrobiota bacterium]
MRALVQRVSRAAVRLPSGESRGIGRGLLIYLAIGRQDSAETCAKLAQKCAALRIFSNELGKFDRSVADEKGGVLLISQFTLYGDARGGRRPDFTTAAPPEQARPLYERFAACLREAGLAVSTGEFAQHMEIESVNDGPVTLWLDSERL